MQFRYLQLVKCIIWEINGEYMLVHVNYLES